MIKLSHAIEGINFIFDSEGIYKFTDMIAQLLAGETAIVETVPFQQKDDTERMITLTLNSGENNTYKLSKANLKISVEREDLEDAVKRFRDAQANPENLYPEWIQVLNLSGRRNTYLYVSYQQNL